MCSDQPPRHSEIQRKTFSHRIEPVIVDLAEYSENTTVHGIKYLGKPDRPLIEKLYWIIIFVICFIFLGTFLQEIIKQWDDHLVIVVEDDIPTMVFKIPFPAVTICPQTKMKVAEFSYDRFFELAKREGNNSKEYNEYFKKYQLAQQICHYTATNEFDTSNETLDKSHIELLYKISPSHYNTLDKISMPNSCSMYNFTYPEIIDNFAAILTNEGLCYTFNLPTEILKNETIQIEYPYHNITDTIQGWNYEKGFQPNSTFPRRSCSAGEVSSLRILLSSQVSDLNSLCQPTDVGYRVILHSPAVYPTTFESYIPVNHESLVKIGVTPRMIKTSQSLRSYTVEQRQCYFNDERKLQYYRFYNRNNCKLECFANYTLQHHGCVHFALPRGPDTKICGGHLNFLHLYETVDSYDTLINYLEDFPNEQDSIGFNKNTRPTSTCDCLPECNSIEYEYKISTEHFKYEKLLSSIEHLWNYSDATNLIPAYLEIFWNEPKYMGKTRKQLYTFSDLISNVGGLLGLFMGASLLSFFEIVYFCLLRQMAKCR